MGGISALSDIAQHPTVESSVEAMREFLGMEVAFATEWIDDQQHFRFLRGDRESFNLSEGMSVPLGITYCQRVMAGRLPNIVPDARADDRTASMPVTEALDVGAFVSVPLRFSDGSLYGTLCAGSHEARPDLGYRELQFLHVFARLVSDQLERESMQRAARDLELQAVTAQTLMAAVEARDSYTGEHSARVVEHAVAVARHLALGEAEIAEIRHVALLHDIGKLAVPDTILRKQGPLTDDEWDVMRTHPISSDHLIRNVPGLAHLAPAIRAEHERWDGSGYPDGLAGEEIPLASRITLACDAYHAMTSDRPYRAAMSDERARTEIRAGAGTQFCPTAARALLDVLDAGA